MSDDAGAGARPRGILAIWHDITKRHAEDTLTWYDQEHHPERLAVPGFRNVRRYRALQGNPELFIRYETDDVGVLSSAAYLARLNAPTPWTLRAQPTFRNNSRTVMIREAAVGNAEGGLAVTARLAPGEGIGAGTSAWRALSTRLIELSGVVRVELWRADQARSSIATREKELRGVEDSHVDAVVVVHATAPTTAEAVAGALRDLLAIAGIHRPEIGIYALSFMASNSTS